MEAVGEEGERGEGEIEKLGGKRIPPATRRRRRRGIAPDTRPNSLFRAMTGGDPELSPKAGETSEEIAGRQTGGTRADATIRALCKFENRRVLRAT